jgi:hypothetical protein
MYNEQLQQQKQSKDTNSKHGDNIDDDGGDDDDGDNNGGDATDRQLSQGRVKIYQLAHDLERRMREFDERVARRRYILDVNLNFHTHCEEVCHVVNIIDDKSNYDFFQLVFRLVDTSRSCLVDDRRR